MESYCEVHWFAERDIDVCLAEELRVNQSFCNWFLGKIGSIDSIVAPAYRTRISVCQDRETDVEALFHDSHGRTFAVLIENKIKADFQKNQLEDYIKRGQRGKLDGKWHEFSVVLFAPSYRALFIPDGVVRVNFEDAAKQLRLAAKNDTRMKYRAAFLERAAQSNIVTAENVDGFVIEWWQATNSMVKKAFGDFFRPQTPCKTTYIAPRFRGQPQYLRLDLKGDQGEVALAFLGFSEKLLNSCVESIKPEDIEILKKPRWKDPVLRIGNLEKFEIDDGLDVIETRVRAAYDAAYRLVSFWKTNRLLFENATINS